MTDKPPLIQMIGLDKRYQDPGREVQVLKSLDLTVKSGEALAIMGASGVGKSTLLHIMGALDRPSRGKVLVEGRDIFALSDAELAAFRNRYVGFVFQFHHLLADFSALENVMMPCLVARESRAEAEKKALALLDEVGLLERRSHLPGELSGGEQQRVAVARALVREPVILLADEPTGNLDEKTGEKINHLFIRLNRRRGLTMVAATHNSTLASSLGRSVHLAGGKIHMGE